jgi:hypothetical protein
MWEPMVCTKKGNSMSRFHRKLKRNRLGSLASSRIIKILNLSNKLLREEAAIVWELITFSVQNLEEYILGLESGKVRYS